MVYICVGVGVSFGVGFGFGFGDKIFGLSIFDTSDGRKRTKNAATHSCSGIF